MSCTSVALVGIAKECENNLGGIKKAYVALYDDVASKTVTNDEISEITMASGSKFKTFEFKRNTSTLTSTLTKTDGGAKYWTSELNMLFNRMETAKRTAINALVAAEACVIVEDANGKVWFLGYDEPVESSAGDAQTGTVRDDANRYSITLQDISKEAPYEINATYWAASGSSLVEA